MAEAALNRIYSGKEGMTEALEEEGALQLCRLKRGIKPLQGVVMVGPLARTARNRLWHDRLVPKHGLRWR